MVGLYIVHLWHLAECRNRNVLFWWMLLWLEYLSTTRSLWGFSYLAESWLKLWLCYYDGVGLSLWLGYPFYMTLSGCFLLWYRLHLWFGLVILYIAQRLDLTQLPQRYLIIVKHTALIIGTGKSNNSHLKYNSKIYILL